jgi:2-amino-4-hydroxy-6-hydroxymethyldihydropteridine diphosphokinase
LNRVAIGLGSNLGHREGHLGFAVDRLRDFLTALRVSSWRETEPVGVDPQPRFLNGALTGDTRLTPSDLLQQLMDIERERGRVRLRAGAARTLDLDLILYGQEIIDRPGLRVPHPRFRERMFVLEPLAEIAGTWIDPETGQTIAELFSAKRLEAPGRA